MSGSFGEMGNLLKQAQQMQRELERAREELRNARIEGVAGGGAVRIEVSGAGQAVRVQIQREALASGDPTLVEDLVLAAMRDALGRAEKQREERMSRVTGGLSLPGIF